MELGPSAAPALDVRGLVKSFDGRPVLAGVDLTVRAGEVRALLGANGAGKSTLISCLSGANIPDGGTIALNGVIQAIRSPRDSLNAGLSVIYQHFSVHDGMSVADNIFLGSELTTRGRLRKRDELRAARQLLDGFDVRIDPRVHVGDLSVSEKQLVEIAKALHRRPHVLVLDEPTAALGEREAAVLLDEVRRLADVRGVGVVYVSHRLDEVFAIADSITVLRDGGVALEGPRASLRREDVIAAISPLAATPSAAVPEVRRSDPTRLLLETRGLSVGVVGGLDLDVAAGSCVALYGNMDSGASDVLRALSGVIARSGGEVRVDGQDYHPSTPVQAIRRGVAFVPGERKQALLPDLPASDNVMVARRALGSAPWMRKRAQEGRAFAELADEMVLSPRLPTLPARFFSGGNQQKILIGRWLLARPGIKVLLLDEPTQGVDIAARAEIWKRIRQALAEREIAVVFRSSDPDEVLQLGTDVVVLSRGTVTLRTSVSDARADQLIAAAHAAERTKEPAGG
ncbi:sugar ABC transporter ATP-binding protein [Blastococcus sp. CT_GayMR20]|uniref:sugar ABC transporter ATP-binding protein n=1 Tax=Blastococcus sp. CT_GayMR20 TaxID=2559609 RepID=UPI00107415D6|nr:sugar ABC transporter ATP-binding protein [Blastococcus sp. CT_GayMR20]TFV87260.1 sugar ABC transporter ATP-binding protein [Blastococcus sp. CT_GayMR20]TFV87279.1 sugar ABC transporter ATP-binding protein [Blastococcus sp. CT_GayMR20]